MTYLCVGGPWDGKRVALQRGQESLVLPSTEPLIFSPAWMDTTKPHVPEASVVVNHHTYKLKNLGFGSGGGDFDARMKVLAYYGRERQDRPDGFYL